MMTHWQPMFGALKIIVFHRRGVQLNAPTMTIIDTSYAVGVSGGLEGHGLPKPLHRVSRVIDNHFVIHECMMNAGK
jgi:hypothetical protein